MKSLLFISASALMSSIFINAESEPAKIVFGTFGGDGITAPKIELNADYTFHYVDNTKASKPIDITGNWESYNNQIHLIDVNNKKVMDDMEITREGKCLKARKGMAFYTLCNCN
jgi:hypothetical protein